MTSAFDSKTGVDLPSVNLRYPVVMQEGQSLAGVILVLLVVIQDERTPHEAAVGVQRGVLRPLDINHYLISVGS